MRFPHAARLELDELLEQLVARARDVQDIQGRLRGLLRAYLAVARSDDLDVVLRQIVEAARELVNARYAALGVIAAGRLVQFLHTGMAAEVVAAIGHLPEGKGLLGLLVDYPQSLRLPEIADHVASVGFPDHHPPMSDAAEPGTPPAVLRLSESERRLISASATRSWRSAWRRQEHGGSCGIDRAPGADGQPLPVGRRSADGQL
jgi:hypothetical protein